MTKLKRIMAIHDMSCFGKCSLTIALPVLSSMGLEVCPLPTALLSTHTGIKGFSFLDLTEHMDKAIKHFQLLNLKFNSIYSGFLGSEKQIDMVLKLVRIFGALALKVIDPVMGDNGKIYATYTPQMCNSMRELVNIADVITPNLTEASILLDKSYPKEPPNCETLQNWLVSLSKMGPRFVVITGIIKENDLNNIAYDSQKNAFYSFKSRKINGDFSGTGDLFASVLTGCLLNDIPFPIALETATSFVYKAICDTVESGRKEIEGLCFEQSLHVLASNIKK